jgi:hypothetical protein
MAQGRIVWTIGKLFEGKVRTIFGTQTPQPNKNGEIVKEWGFGLAIPKDAFVAGGAGLDLWNAMNEEARTMYPNGVIPPSFSMKFKDGDSIDPETGKSHALKEGYAGHIVFSMKTSLPINFFRFENGQNFICNEGIKCGDYVRVQVSVKAHAAMGQGKAGLYLNPNAVQFLGFGKEIISTPTGDQIFGTQAPAMPQGASATPIAPQGMIMPTGQPGMPQMAPPQQPAFQQQQAPPPPVAPNYGVIPQQHQPMGNVVQPGMPGPSGPIPGPSAPMNAFPSNPAVPGMGYPPGNVQQPGQFNAQGVPQTPMGVPTGPSIATNVNPNGMPWQPQ